MFKYKKYNFFIQFGSGAVGDFLMSMDIAIRAHKLCEAKTIIILKGNASFLKTFLKPYPYISVLPYNPKTIIKLMVLAFTNRTCVVWETANAGYKLRVLLFLRFLHHFTPVRIIALQVKEEFSFLGNDAIPFLNDRRIYEIGIQMLNHIGLSVSQEPPHIDFLEDKKILDLNDLSELNYIVVCPTTSSFAEIQRSWSDRRWAQLVDTSLSINPLNKVVFIGGPGDGPRFKSIIKLINQEYKNRVITFEGTLNAQQMMTVFSYAKLFIGVRTGTTAIAACINMKGEIIQLDSRPTETIWHYGFNKKIHFFINLKECKCEPMNFVPCSVRDQEDHLLYHRCNYFIDDAEVLATVKELLSN